MSPCIFVLKEEKLTPPKLLQVSVSFLSKLDLVVDTHGL